MESDFLQSYPHQHPAPDNQLFPILTILEKAKTLQSKNYHTHISRISNHSGRLRLLCAAYHWRIRNNNVNDRCFIGRNDEGANAQATWTTRFFVHNDGVVRSTHQHAYTYL